MVRKRERGQRDGITLKTRGEHRKNRKNARRVRRGKTITDLKGHVAREIASRDPFKRSKKCIESEERIRNWRERRNNLEDEQRQRPV